MLLKKIFISCDVRVEFIDLRRPESIERLHAKVTLDVTK